MASAASQSRIAATHFPQPHERLGAFRVDQRAGRRADDIRVRVDRIFESAIRERIRRLLLCRHHRVHLLLGELGCHLGAHRHGRVGLGGHHLGVLLGAGGVLVRPLDSAVFAGGTEPPQSLTSSSKQAGASAESARAASHARRTAAISSALREGIFKDGQGT